MRLGKIAFAVILGVSTAAQAEDNVFIDLSVLDNLNGAYTAPSEPLFPVLPKKEKVVRKQSKKPIKKVKTADIAPIVDLPEIKEPVVEPDVLVVDVEPVAEADLKVTEEPVVDDKPAVTEGTETAVVAAEETAEKPIIETLKEAEPQSEKTTEKTTMDENSEEKVSEERDSLIQPAPVVNVSTEEPDVEEDKPELLIDDTASATAAEENTIVFEDGIDELSTEQMAKIDSIIGRFKDINANKIAIYSYNLDDGVDSFRKKRVSLNRAVGVRGYLIKQGYKNFSIKVININSGSDKINTVELEEI